MEIYFKLDNYFIKGKAEELAEIIKDRVSQGCIITVDIVPRNILLNQVSRRKAQLDKLLGSLTFYYG